MKIGWLRKKMRYPSIWDVSSFDGAEIGSTGILVCVKQMQTITLHHLVTH